MTDTTGRCPSLLHLTTTTIRLRYCNDKGNYVNINYGDDKGYRKMWNNAIAFNKAELQSIDDAIERAKGKIWATECVESVIYVQDTHKETVLSKVVIQQDHVEILTNTLTKKQSAESLLVKSILLKRT